MQVTQVHLSSFSPGVKIHLRFKLIPSSIWFGWPSLLVLLCRSAESFLMTLQLEKSSLEEGGHGGGDLEHKNP
jgi:hypothetical protein